MINNHIWSPEFNKKEAEIRKLKAELSRIDAEKTRPSLFTQSQPTPVSPPFFETYSPFYTPSRPQQPIYNQFFGFSHLQPTPQPSSPKKARSKVKISEPRPKATSSSSTSTIRDGNLLPAVLDRFSASFQLPSSLLSLPPPSSIRLFVVSRASRHSSPREVIVGSNFQHQMYCHLLCGLRNYEFIDGIISPYAIGLIRAFSFFESKWKQLCDDLENGYPCLDITEVAMRDSVTEPDLKMGTRVATRFVKKDPINLWRKLIMSDFDSDPAVQLNPQASSNVNAENPQTHSISGVCNHCGKGFAGQQSSGTSHLLNHIDRCPKWIQESALAPASSPSQASKVYKKKDAETSTISAFDSTAFDKALARQKIARMIIMHELPLRFVEYEGFRDLMSFVQPLLGKICRNTVKREVFKLFDFEKAKTMALLEDITSKVSITTDMWTSSHQKKGYMVVTVHFIDNSWTLRNRILRFIYVPSPHTAEALFNELAKCLLDWNVDRRLSTIIIDNCSTNDAMILLLLAKFPPGSFLLNGKLLHVRCCAHILNLIVKDGLDAIGDGIEKVRNSVNYWTSSPKRIELFEDTANRQLKLNCSKSLVLDCKTRWNSTYLMLEVALIYKDVFTRLKHRDNQYKHLPTEVEWELARVVCEHLKPFYTMTEMFSGTKYPTTNLFFPIICEIRLSLNAWLNSSCDVIKNMAKSMLEKFGKYWDEIQGVMVVAVVLDPRYKMVLVDYFFPQIYGSDALTHIDRIRTLCSDLYSEYKKKSLVGSNLAEGFGESSVVCNSNSSSVVMGMWDVKKFNAFKSQHIRKRVKSELDTYLEEEDKTTPDFDILMWWKVNRSRYPILSEIARDLLAVPVSTVASESAFSAGG
ncbi:BED-type domain-containing protein [Citrus sinensis]|nr:BED-type domain-containing protein [Citrus sinensis]